MSKNLLTVTLISSKVFGEMFLAIQHCIWHMTLNLKRFKKIDILLSEICLYIFRRLWISERYMFEDQVSAMVKPQGICRWRQKKNRHLNPWIFFMSPFFSQFFTIFANLSATYSNILNIKVAEVSSCESLEKIHLANFFYSYEISYIFHYRYCSHLANICFRVFLQQIGFPRYNGL